MTIDLSLCVIKEPDTKATGSTLIVEVDFFIRQFSRLSSSTRTVTKNKTILMIGCWILFILQMLLFVTNLPINQNVPKVILNVQRDWMIVKYWFTKQQCLSCPSKLNKIVQHAPCEYGRVQNENTSGCWDPNTLSNIKER